MARFGAGEGPFCVSGGEAENGGEVCHGAVRGVDDFGFFVGDLFGDFFDGDDGGGGVRVHGWGGGDVVVGRWYGAGAGEDRGRWALWWGGMAAIDGAAFRLSVLEGRFGHGG